MRPGISKTNHVPVHLKIHHFDKYEYCLALSYFTTYQNYHHFQVLKSRYGPDFQGLRFENHPKETKKLGNRWQLLYKFYESKIQRRLSKSDEKSKSELAKFEEQLKSEIFLSLEQFPGLLAEFSQNPPRNPQNPP